VSGKHRRVRLGRGAQKPGVGSPRRPPAVLARRVVDNANALPFASKVGRLCARADREVVCSIAVVCVPDAEGDRLCALLDTELLDATISALEASEHVISGVCQPVRGYTELCRHGAELPFRSEADPRGGGGIVAWPPGHVRLELLGRDVDAWPQGPVPRAVPRPSSPGPQRRSDLRLREPQLLAPRRPVLLAKLVHRAGGQPESPAAQQQATAAGALQVLGGVRWAAHAELHVACNVVVVVHLPLALVRESPSVLVDRVRDAQRLPSAGARVSAEGVVAHLQVQRPVLAQAASLDERPRVHPRGAAAVAAPCDRPNAATGQAEDVALPRLDHHDEAGPAAQWPLWPASWAIALSDRLRGEDQAEDLAHARARVAAEVVVAHLAEG